MKIMVQHFVYWTEVFDGKDPISLKVKDARFIFPTHVTGRLIAQRPDWNDEGVLCRKSIVAFILFRLVARHFVGFSKSDSHSFQVWVNEI